MKRLQLTELKTPELAAREHWRYRRASQGERVEVARSISNVNQVTRSATREADAAYDQRKNNMGLLGATLLVLAFLFGMWALQQVIFG